MDGRPNYELLCNTQQNTDSSDSDEVLCLANQIFTAFPKELTGLRFYILDCGCIYYQRVFRDGNLDAQIGIYLDAENGPCETCLAQAKTWENRVIDEKVAYNSKFQIETL